MISVLKLVNIEKMLNNPSINPVIISSIPHFFLCRSPTRSLPARSPVSRSCPPAAHHLLPRRRPARSSPAVAVRVDWVRFLIFQFLLVWLEVCPADSHCISIHSDTSPSQTPSKTVHKYSCSSNNSILNSNSSSHNGSSNKRLLNSSLVGSSNPRSSPEPKRAYLGQNSASSFSHYNNGYTGFNHHYTYNVNIIGFYSEQKWKWKCWNYCPSLSTLHIISI